MSERGREKGGESGTLIHPSPFLKPTKLRHTHRRAPHRLLQKAFNDAPFTSSLPKLFDWAPLLCKVKSTRPSLKRHYLARFAITGEKQLVKLNLYSASGNLLTCFDCHDWMGEGGQSRMRNLTSERESSALRRTRRTRTDGRTMPRFARSGEPFSAAAQCRRKPSSLTEDTYKSNLPNPPQPTA